MIEPLSPRNAEVARLRALTRQRRARREAGRFVVEGVKLVAEVLQSDLDVVGVYHDADWDSTAEIERSIVERDIESVVVSARGIERIASTTSPQPVVAEVVLPIVDDATLEGASKLLVAVDLNDPGNVGTLTRSAEAAGFDAVVTLGDTADPWGPKTLRAAAGALFRVPVVEIADAGAGLDRLGELGFLRVGTRMSDAEPCDTSDLSGRLALVLGSEAHGLGDAHEARIDRWLAIPMAGQVESLNVAMAGTILTYEIARQGRSSL